MSPGPFVDPIEPRVTDDRSDAEELQRRVDSANRGGARAAVLGVNDGLVTNVCLILAVAGADSSASAVRIAGFASLVAGAFSMAAGEWVSVRSQVEIYEGLLAELRRMVRRNPKLVLDRITDKLVDSGLATDTAQRAATELPLDEHKFLDFSARLVFGLNPDELGSPTTAAVSSLGLFGVGAAIPLLPWFFVDGTTAVAVSVAATAAASVAVGAWVSRSAERPVVRGALRQLVIVVAASAVTYGIGSLFGTAIA
ncbi:MAG: VIT1/CCC1 transporter family protein [Actinobacteria bacterium]|nr:VIT1/CCC1 transporter family protein [Actinomycetota bacterium]